MEPKIYKNKHTIMVFIVFLGICLSVIYLHLLSHEKTQKIYMEQTEKTIIDLKKDFIKDTINNLFIEIDMLRHTKYENYEKNTQSRLKRFEREYDLPEKEFIEYFTDTFENDINPKMWTALLWDNTTMEILYATDNINSKTVEKITRELQTSLSSSASFQKNNINAIFGVSKNFIDDLVKSEMENIIKTRKFSGDSYMWVNEVVNYNGGEDYAIRRVHPNLQNTEGEYLSTNTKDIHGNLPYLEELNGIKKDGELFFQYYFKELNDNQVSEKITYAKLYEDYDWIIAMGVHIDDIDAYAEQVKQETYSLSSEAIIRLLRYIFIVLLVGFVLIYFIDRKRLFNSTKTLERAVNIDTLTGAYSRRYGEKTLSYYHKEYKLTGDSPAIMMFDIDNFKGINDKYGHDIGDDALVGVVKTINNGIRKSDKLIRWGGDEFICILPGLREEIIPSYGKKALKDISLLKIPVGDETISLTVSIGFSFFREADVGYNDVLKRVDTAMYMAKQEGKNRISID